MKLSTRRSITPKERARRTGSSRTARVNTTVLANALLNSFCNRSPPLECMGEVTTCNNVMAPARQHCPKKEDPNPHFWIPSTSSHVYILSSLYPSKERRSESQQPTLPQTCLPCKGLFAFMQATLGCTRFKQDIHTVFQSATINIKA